MRGCRARSSSGTLRATKSWMDATAPALCAAAAPPDLAGAQKVQPAKSSRPTTYQLSAKRFVKSFFV